MNCHVSISLTSSLGSFVLRRKLSVRKAAVWEIFSTGCFFSYNKVHRIKLCVCSDSKTTCLVAYITQQASINEIEQYLTTDFNWLPLSMSRNAPLLIDCRTRSRFRTDEPASVSFSSVTFCCFLTALKSCTTPLENIRKSHFKIFNEW